MASLRAPDVNLSLPAMNDKPIYDVNAQSVGANSKIQPAVMGLAIQLRARRIIQDAVSRSILMPAGPGLDPVATVEELARALHEINEAPVLTIHCGQLSAANQPAQLQTDLVLDQKSISGDASGNQLMLAGESGVPALSRVRFSEHVSVANAVTSAAFGQLLAGAGKAYRHILISSGCPQDHPESALLAQVAHQVIVTVAAKRTRMSEIKAAQSILRRSGAFVLGFLLEAEPGTEVPVA